MCCLKEVIMRRSTLAVILALFMISSGVVAAARRSSTTNVAYSYPIKPGSPEWKALNSHEEMLQVVQIPEEVLARMSTRALVETVLDYPLFGDMFAYNSLQSGFKAVAGNFNGIQELFRRSDGAHELVLKYRTMDPRSIDEKWSLLKRGQYEAQFTFIETLLSQDQVLSSMNGKARRALLKECSVKHLAKLDRVDVFGASGERHTAFLVGRILLIDNDQSFLNDVSDDSRLREFVLLGGRFDAEVISKIYAHIN
jgi:hypothetical protein